MLATSLFSMGMFSAYTQQRLVAFMGGMGGAALMYYTHFHMTQEVVAITSEEQERVGDVLPAVRVLRRNEPKLAGPQATVSGGLAHRAAVSASSTMASLLGAAERS
ncbi:hypothetical protein FNF27_06349 [Cafeteria roenbergensis]|uniref:Uncharacterized protein n=1 Tax=Cafeteria roenbergensis TaxID=33653 RepID=A0A5A8CYM3_CAFRO|nr:hypothetical protein FNF29_04550 [Cafeteria roenbergensis]KAA0152482.1 hypothetical protein FNF31_06631 [Cafeteria roenbergensis]KAA0156881.1 hypothetical protein FNF28_06584 [Cafeteria roenbergensis]KAA0171230.1 hypothetical protein FNF27_06349 [Cafeteria roenbergensis]|mmetsp:Transcript_12816/g.49100  ORF Transcript_12816/g.49100 Transcript_12816/m.49100 type:complete len:106 (+) Transcript_12816:1738-2055(+)|eukprot:KAA0151351.1 hypothetical protein FNF29_04550 [Cafeteria roenbergensis]